MATLPSTARPLVASPWPGLALCALVSLAAVGLGGIERVATGRLWLEPLVLAILIGAGVRMLRAPAPASLPGIRFAAHTLLEVAVMLLGAGASLGTIAGAGLPLLGAIVATVALAIAASLAIGRLFGLPRRMALLIACGNAICGNSAIAAVAPVIEADGEDVAAAIAFTAILGVVAVIALPLVASLLGLGATGGGILAGLTVYAVPQVLAATAPMGPAAVTIGTLVKLVRVLMLGPVVAILSLGTGRRGGGVDLTRLVPWFILGFLALAALRSAGLLGATVPMLAARIADALTLFSMAALGLGVDAHGLLRAGPRVTAVVTLSLLALFGLALAVLRLA